MQHMHCVAQEQAYVYGDDGLLAGFLGNEQGHHGLSGADGEGGLEVQHNNQLMDDGGMVEIREDEHDAEHANGRGDDITPAMHHVGDHEDGVEGSWHTHGSHLLGVVEAPTPGPFSGTACGEGMRTT